MERLLLFGLCSHDLGFRERKGSDAFGFGKHILDVSYQLSCQELLRKHGVKAAAERSNLEKQVNNPDTASSSILGSTLVSPVGV